MLCIKIIINIGSFLLIFIFIYGFLQLAFVLPMKNIINTCEERAWDGSELVASYEPFTGDPVITIICSKGNESEVIDLIDSISISTQYRSLVERFTNTNEWQEGNFTCKPMRVCMNSVCQTNEGSKICTENKLKEENNDTTI